MFGIIQGSLYIGFYETMNYVIIDYTFFETFLFTCDVYIKSITILNLLKKHRLLNTTFEFKYEVGAH